MIDIPVDSPIAERAPNPADVARPTPRCAHRRDGDRAPTGTGDPKRPGLRGSRPQDQHAGLTAAPSSPCLTPRGASLSLPRLPGGDRQLGRRGTRPPPRPGSRRRRSDRTPVPGGRTPIHRIRPARTAREGPCPGRRRPRPTPWRHRRRHTDRRSPCGAQAIARQIAELRRVRHAAEHQAPFEDPRLHRADARIAVGPKGGQEAQVARGAVPAHEDLGDPRRFTGELGPPAIGANPADRAGRAAPALRRCSRRFDSGRCPAAARARQLRTGHASGKVVVVMGAAATRLDASAPAAAGRPRVGDGRGAVTVGRGLGVGSEVADPLETPSHR